VVQTVVALMKNGIQPGIDDGDSNAEAFGNGQDGEVVSDHEQGRDVLDLREVAGAKGSLKVEGQGVDSLAAKGNGRCHGVPPLSGESCKLHHWRIQHPVSGYDAESRTFPSRMTIVLTRSIPVSSRYDNLMTSKSTNLMTTQCRLIALCRH
jgi:hypothetical protein